LSVKSSLELVLYCHLNMPTINKTYLILFYLTLIELFQNYLLLNLHTIYDEIAKMIYFCSTHMIKHQNWEQWDGS
jgi:hypothetical protein